MITVATICRNEEGRWLESAIGVWQQFSDRIVAVNDGSTDRTGEILRDHGAIVHDKDITLCGNSSKGRRMLWELAAPKSEWVVILDADLIPASDPFQYVESGFTQLAFRYFDLWGPNVFRDDPWWTAHHRPRVWAVRTGAFDCVWDWPDIAVHSEHIPANVYGPVQTMPLEASYLHYGYSTPEARQRQYDKYMGVWDKLNRQQRYQTKTIIQDNPKVYPLPFEPEWTL